MSKVNMTETNPQNENTFFGLFTFPQTVDKI